jgi:hypothetical protein
MKTAVASTPDRLIAAKRCARCDEPRAVRRFPFNPRMPDGLHNVCLDCICAAAARDRAAREKRAQLRAETRGQI